MIPIQASRSGNMLACRPLLPLRSAAIRSYSGTDMIGEENTREIEDQLSSLGTVLRLGTGETLYVEGEAAGKCYEVISGLVKEYNTLTDGSCHITDFRYAGDLMGLPCSGVYQHTVEAVTETCLISYPARRFRELVAGRPALSAWLAQKLLSDLERSRANALALSRLSAMERVARFLLTLSEATGPSERLNGAYAIPMSRQDMADHLGLTIETVCRCLTTLKRNGLIVMPTAHGFEIPDQESLSAVASREDLPPTIREMG